MSASRREFLVAACATAAGLLIGLPARGASRAPPSLADFVDAYIEVRRDGMVRIVAPQSEMGQGVHDALARILAEELEVDWTRVQISLPHADRRFANPVSGRQLTGDSTSVRHFHDHLRRIGAAAREMFVSAAAEQWGVGAGSCRAELGTVIHEPTGRRLAYAELVDAAARRPAPANPPLKAPADLKLIGRSIHRKDVPDKITGRALYGVDIRLPGMLIACVRMPDGLGARITGFRAEAAMALGGVEKIVAIEGAVAVLARSYWHAQRGARAIELTLTDASALDDAVVDKALVEALRIGPAQLDATRQSAERRMPDLAAAEREYARCERQLDVEYTAPFLPHLNMEPQVCTALVTDERCEIWAPHQQPDAARELAASLTGLPLEAVTLHVTFLGTGFGRKWEVDTVRQCVQIARQMRGRPIKLMWSREQDTRHDFYRPATRVRTRIGLANDNAAATTMISRIAGQSLFAFLGLPTQGTADPLTTGDLIAYYAIEHSVVEGVAVALPVPIGFWRSVAHSHNGFYREAAIDEAALLAKADPYLYRRALLAADSRAVAVLDAAAKAIGWQAPQDARAGRGRGIAFGACFGSYCAHAIEVEIEDRSLRIARVVCAIDCGLVIDPDIVAAQIEGGTLFGFSAALTGGVSWHAGAVRQSNFHDQPVLRLNQAPHVHVIRIESRAAHGGIGETAVPTAIAALANAVSAASGRRVRELPLARLGYVV